MYTRIDNTLKSFSYLKDASHLRRSSQVVKLLSSFFMLETSTE